MLERLGGEAPELLAVLGGVLAQEVRRQQRGVRRTRAQGGHLQADDVEAIEEILAELPLLDHPLEVAVGRGDDPHVDADGLVSAHPLELPLLQKAKQLHLHGRRDLADLVEEQRPVVGLLEPAVAPGLGAR